MMPTRPIADQRALEVELLRRLATFARAVTLAEMFDRLVQPWAVEACDRLMIAGLVRELAGERLELTAAGRAALSNPK